ncbi:hypothetical protein [Hymenobacter properus]|uniref:Uncharacterized protein n=1 Tax=Hymenobacter properus TaxID=2791026 RepID=A0A931BIB1_9BACT|nr:hypothetical protein [Hymenobacter properus]MBF9144504.1 hypothetical protein [Hymenobacter properus]MBR7723322.1 hypothetical protein [Microvirga sp. SRT04]
MRMPSEILESILDAELEKFSEISGLPGSAVVNIVREMDIVYLYLRGSGQFDAAYTDYFETIHQYGWPLLLQAWYSKIEQSEFQQILYSNNDITAWADSVIHATGKLAFARQLVMFCKMGFASISQPTESEFVFAITDSYSNAEFFDLHDWQFVQKHIVGQLTSKKADKDRFDANRVYKRIMLSVKSPDRRTIAYQATPYVTEYFIQQGRQHIFRKQVHDDFDEADLFGQVPYGAYVTMVEYLAGLALLHKAFCEAAHKKYDRLELRNIISLFCSREGVVADLARYLGRTGQEVSGMLNHITLNNDNYQAYLSIPRIAPPPFVQVSDSQLLRSTAGCLNNPFQFLNHELKRTCELDYSKAVNNREERFRRMIFGFFTEDRFVRIPVEIRMSIDGRETDIDAVVFDKVTKSLGLFQLKWQDPFANSMQKRRSVISNLQKNALSWLDKVVTWVERTDVKTTLNALQITRHSPAEKAIGNVYFFIIGRHGIHFTGVEQDERAAWGSWPQLLAGAVRITKQETEHDPIKHMHSRLKHDAPRLRMERDGSPVLADFNLRFENFQVRHESRTQ